MTPLAFACPACHADLGPAGPAPAGAARECPDCSARYHSTGGWFDFTSGRVPALTRFVDVEAIADRDLRVQAAQVFYHDRVGIEYERDWSTAGIFTEASRRRIARALAFARRLAGDGPLLDVGTGTGNVLRVARGVFSRGIGVDLSDEMLRVCTDQGLDVARAEAGRLPFPDGSFRVVTAFSVLHHLVSPEAIFPEVLRVLAPGGVFYTDWDQNRHVLHGTLFLLCMNRFHVLPTLWRTLLLHLKRDDLSRAFKLAEFHPFTEHLDGEALRDDLLRAGFRVARVIYHSNGRTIFDEAERLPADLVRLPENTQRRLVLPVFALVAQKR